MKAQKGKMAHLREVKERYQSQLLEKANVVGVGIGYRKQDDPQRDEPSLIVNVTHKVPLSRLAPKDRVPSELDGVPVRVEAVGTPRAAQIRHQSDTE